MAGFIALGILLVLFFIMVIAKPKKIKKDIFKFTTYIGIKNKIENKKRKLQESLCLNI